MAAPPDYISSGFCGEYGRMWKLTTAKGLATLAAEKIDFARLLERDDFDVGLYKPERIDTQSPHRRDELYVIATGSGTFRMANETTPVAVGDILFVPRDIAHRFEDFTDDFSAWVIFFGPRR